MKTRIASFSILALVGLPLATIVAETKAFHVCVVGPAIQPQSTNPPYLREMPTVDRVKHEIQGKNPMDTAARQAGAFWQLRQVILDIALSQGRTRQFTPDEVRLTNEYFSANYNALQPVEKSLSPQDRPSWFILQNRYQTDEKLLDEVFTRLGMASVRAEYGKANAAFAKRHEEYVRERNEEQAQVQAQSQAQAQGTYYLVVTIRYNNQDLLWNLRITLQPGANSVTLDQRNAVPG